MTDGELDEISSYPTRMINGSASRYETDIDSISVFIRIKSIDGDGYFCISRRRTYSHSQEGFINR